MSNYDIIYMGKKAKELGFIRDTMEKVTRLADILEFFQIEIFNSMRNSLKANMNIYVIPM